MAELRPATTTTAFCYNCHRYLLRPATGFVTSVYFFRMQMFATTRSFLLQPCLHFSTTNNEKCYNGQLYLREPVNRQRGGAASMACVGGIHPWRARTAKLHPWRARPEELHPWRARISDERVRRSCMPASMATVVLGQTQKAGEGAHRRRGNAAVVLQARLFSRGLWRGLGGARGRRQRFCERKKGAERIVFLPRSDGLRDLI